MTDDDDTPSRPWRDTLVRLFRHRLFLTGLALFSLVLLAGLAAPWAAGVDPSKIAMRARFRPPSLEYPFGTDNLGRSLWSRVLWGAQLSMIIGIAVVVLNAMFGTLIGALAGYVRWLDKLIMGFNDAMMAFPAVLLAIGITAALGSSVLNVIIALSIVYIPRTARIVRASVIVLREMEFVQAAVAAGAGHWRILSRHIMPNAVAPLVVQLSFLFAYAVLTEATLSFLGLGAVPAHAHLGQHHGRRPAIPDGRTLDHHHPRHRPDADRAGPQPARRRPAGRAGPAPADPAMTLLSVDNLTVAFATGRGPVNAVESVTLSIAPGEVLGIVGESGSGKSVTALAIMGLLPRPPARVLAGRIVFEGTELLGLSERGLRRIRGPGIGMVFQEPMSSLNPVFTIGDQIGETLRAHERLGPAARRTRTVALLDRVGIPSAARRLDDYPHQMSGGQRQRVMIAIALACNPRLLIADEPTTALDVTIQAQILDLLLELRAERGMAVMLITHNMGVVAETADRVLVMYSGQVVEQSPAAALFERPAHPYTSGLLACVPSLDMDLHRLHAIAGSLPDPARRPTGCRFAPRCPLHTADCDAAVPPLLAVHAGHEAACIRAAQ